MHDEYEVDLSDSAADTDDRAIDAVFVDWAGTITRPMIELFRNAIAGAALDQPTTDAVITGLAQYLTGDDSPLHQAERGEITDDELWDWLDAQTPTGDAQAEELFAGDQPWAFLNAPDRPEMAELLADLMEADVFVAITTNNFAAAQDRLSARYLGGFLASAVVNSALIGIRKPDPAFFELVLETFELDPGRVLVLDDNEANLRCARQLGMQAIAVGDDATDAVRQTRRLIGLSDA